MIGNSIENTWISNWKDIVRASIFVSQNIRLPVTNKKTLPVQCRLKFQWIIGVDIKFLGVLSTIFGKKMVQSWPEFYADYGGTNSFWKFWDLDQNNPVLEFVKFSANISVYVHPIGPKFGSMDSFLTLNKMTEQVFENSKILENFGIKIQSHQYEINCNINLEGSYFIRTGIKFKIIFFVIFSKNFLCPFLYFENCN